MLAYQFDTRRNVVEVLDVGPHENFYRELRKYLDAR
ncbi:MAG: type II toxin-antitoxin system RelE/ParE family toxin [Candidatus Rokubacteria bacterium]|nr:type II toxin-antitoxin system RelE/ParE family toxin [Candidatus Rokubacteria bacterium]